VYEEGRLVLTAISISHSIKFELSLSGLLWLLPFLTTTLSLGGSLVCICSFSSFPLSIWNSLRLFIHSPRFSLTDCTSSMSSTVQSSCVGGNTGWAIGHSPAFIGWGTPPVFFYIMRLKRIYHGSALLYSPITRKPI